MLVGQLANKVLYQLERLIKEQAYSCRGSCYQSGSSKDGNQRRGVRRFRKNEQGTGIKQQDE